MIKTMTWEIWESILEDPTPGLLLDAVLNSVDEGVFIRELFMDNSDEVGGVIFEDAALCDAVEQYYRTVRENAVFWHLDKVEDIVTGESEVDPPIVICGCYDELFEVTASDGKLSVNWYTGRKYLLGVGMTEEEVADFLF